MDIYEAVKYLIEEGNIIIDKIGNEYQRYNKDNIFITYGNKTKEYENGNIGSTIKNVDFLKNNIKNIFEIKLQFYQKPMILPMLCKVKENGWNNYKIVCLNYFSGTMFNTGFGESYIPSIRTEIIPLTNDEINNFKVKN